MMGNIEFLPMADMPEHLKDGRPVLGAIKGRTDPGGCVVMRRRPKWGSWSTVPGDWTYRPTHFAELNGPDWIPEGFVQPNVMSD